ncbi:stress-induced protein [Aerococcaceae bacterium NML160702]|nr:stress-induced protein [Aerococcaceae bacterium NML160702]
MAREDLIPFNERTEEEQKRIASLGGKASGVARRKKADLKKAFETILQADVASETARKQLESMGFEATNEMLLALATFQSAAKGNQRAVENIIRLTNTKDAQDLAEQKERIKAMKMQNKRVKAEMDAMAQEIDTSVVIVDEWAGEDDGEEDS